MDPKGPTDHAALAHPRTRGTPTANGDPVRALVLDPADLDPADPVARSTTPRYPTGSGPDMKWCRPNSKARGPRRPPNSAGWGPWDVHPAAPIALAREQLRLIHTERFRMNLPQKGGAGWERLGKPHPKGTPRWCGLGAFPGVPACSAGVFAAFTTASSGLGFNPKTAVVSAGPATATASATGPSPEPVQNPMAPRPPTPGARARHCRPERPGSGSHPKNHAPRPP